jgi:PIN domain nuclease of toxin-antitoxin system
MKLLLDTHVVLWWLDDPIVLSNSARDAIADFHNEVFVSAAVAWEIAIKRGLGKLAAPTDLQSAIKACQFSPLPITVDHALATEKLPLHHRDPFDRMLVAQALIDNLTVVSARSQHRTLWGGVHRCIATRRLAEAPRDQEMRDSSPADSAPGSVIGTNRRSL